MTPTSRAGRPLTDAELRRRENKPADTHPWAKRVMPTTPGDGRSLYRRDSALVARLNRGPFPVASPCEIEGGIQFKTRGAKR